MNKTNDGGNAFPLPLGTGNLSEPSESGGMSIRDYFAAKAMQSLVNRSDTYNYDTTQGVESLSANAYAIADAMLAVREAA